MQEHHAAGAEPFEEELERRLCGIVQVAVDAHDAETLGGDFRADRFREAADDEPRVAADAVEQRLDRPNRGIGEELAPAGIDALEIAAVEA